MYTAKLILSLIASVLMGLSFCSNTDDELSKGSSREGNHEFPPIALAQKVEIQSILPKQEKTAYLLFDADPMSFWVAESPSGGVGKYFEISLSKEILFNRIVIQQGNETFRRVKKVLILCESEPGGGKIKKNVYLTDKRNPQVIAYDSFIGAKKITLYIQEVYFKKGIEAEASALAEVSFFYDKEKVKLIPRSDLVKDQIREPLKTVSPPRNITPIPVKRVLVSSYKHMEKQKIEYKGQNLIDGDSKTSWIEGHPGDGTNEYVQFDLSVKAFTLKGLSLVNGYTAGSKQFNQYNRVKEISVEVGIESPQGTVYLPEKILTLMDKPDLQFVPLNIKVGMGQKSDRKVFITLTIHSLYYGRRSKETALSEVTFYKAKGSSAF